MSDKNFMSYDDAAEVLGTFAERIKDDEYENITYEQWLAKTDEQKEAGNFLVSGVPNADGKVTIEGCKRLWINPSGNVEFAAQTVELDLGTYDMILVTYYNACTAVAYVGSNGHTSTCQTFNGRLINEDRIMSVSVVGVTFQDCYRHQQTSAGSQFTSTVFNTSCVPAAIYGIKLNHQLEIQAIARDVSTSADKCMLTSDPTKSVETMLTNFGFTVHTDWSTGSQGSGNYITISNIGGWQEFKYVTISEPGWYFVHMQCHYYLSESGVTPGYGKEMSTGIRATGNHGNLVIGSGESVGSTNNSYGMSHSYAMVYIAVADDQILCQAYAGPTGATLKVYGTVQILKLQKN